MTSEPERPKPITPRTNLLAWTTTGDPGAYHPESVAPSVLHFIHTWGFYLTPEERQRFIHPAIPQALRSNRPGSDLRATQLAANWLLHVNTPAWLGLAGLEHTAQTLHDHPEVPNSRYGDKHDPALSAVLHQAARASWQQMERLGLSALITPGAMIASSTASASAASTSRHPLVSTLSQICNQAATIAIHEGTDTLPLVQTLKASAAELLVKMCEAPRSKETRPENVTT